MPLSNAERQKKWRVTHGLEGRKKVEIVLDVPTLPPLKKMPTKPLKRDNPLSEATKKLYTKAIEVIYKDYKGRDIWGSHPIFNVLDNKTVNFKDVKEEFAFLNQTDVKELVTKHSRNAIYLYNVVRCIRGFGSFVKKIHPYRLWLDDKYQERRDEVTIEPISFEREEVLRRFNELDDVNDKIAYGLLMLIPPRRIGEYLNTIIPKGYTKYPNTYNYYDDGKILIYNSKVDIRNGVARIRDEPIYVVEVPPEVIEIIDMSKDKIINKDINVSLLFKKIYGHPYTNMDIRRLYASHIKDIKYYQRRMLADAMGHSVEQNLRYVL